MDEAAQNLSRIRPSPFRTAESTIGALFAFIVGFVVVVIGGDVAYLAIGSGDEWWLISIYVIAVAGESCFLYWLKRSLERGMYPIAPNLAINQIRWPIALRPIVAGWWLVHFLLGVVTVIFVESRVSMSDLPVPRKWTAICIVVGVLFTLTHTSLLYLLLAISALSKSEDVIWTIWKRRILVDLLVTGVGIATSFAV